MFCLLGLTFVNSWSFRYPRFLGFFRSSRLPWFSGRLRFGRFDRWWRKCCRFRGRWRRRSRRWKRLNWSGWRTGEDRTGYRAGWHAVGCFGHLGLLLLCFQFR